MKRRYLILDYETRSEANLKAVGGYEYAVHPSTELLCVSWSLGTWDELLERPPVKSWSDHIRMLQGYGELIRALEDESVICVAQNAMFEQLITRFVLPKLFNRPALKMIPHSRWRCTAAQAAAVALPRKLADAGAALGLPIQKDQVGHRLMLKMTKPRKPTKKSSAKWHESEDDLIRLIEYCETDVAAEREIFLTVPQLSHYEQRLWELDQTINFRGFTVDRPLVKTALKLIEEETTHLHKTTDELTYGVLTSTLQRDGVLEWLESEGVFLPDLKAKTVSDALAAGLVQGDAEKLLKIRQVISKTSTKKYLAFENRSRSDGRHRDHLLFNAASTRRWGGMGAQIQNLPRGTIKNTIQAAEIIMEGDLELIRLIYGDPMSVLSSCLRSVVIASPGKDAFFADYNAIETRVLFWLADHEKGIKAFEDGRDLYCEMATEIFGRPITKADTFERFVGKESVLGCGYGMGDAKFVGTCENKGVKLDPGLAKKAVKSYRKKHSPIPRLWSRIERAAIAAVENPGKKFTVNKTSWYVRGRFLFCVLPSGGRLAYCDPQVRYETKWDEKRACLYHYDVHPKTRKWVLNGTWGGKLVENVIQATARDFMADAMLRIEAEGFEIIGSVHDELWGEALEGTRTAEEFNSLMAELPPWGSGCPIKVEGWSGKRYRK